jgi:hypothetical protein
VENFTQPKLNLTPGRKVRFEVLDLNSDYAYRILYRHFLNLKMAIDKRNCSLSAKRAGVLYHALSLLVERPTQSLIFQQVMVEEKATWKPNHYGLIENYDEDAIVGIAIDTLVQYVESKKNSMPAEYQHGIVTVNFRSFEASGLKKYELTLKEVDALEVGP